MVKVLQVFNELDQGGIEHVVINWMKSMDPCKVEFHFALMSGKPGVLDDKVRKLGGHIHYFSSGEKSLGNVRRNLSNIINKYGPFQVVHSHTYFFSGYILYVAKKKGVPIRIAHAHDTYKGEHESIKRKVYEHFMREMINKYATYKFGVSSDTCRHVFGKKDGRTFIVHNGVDIERYRFNESQRKHLREKLKIEDDEYLLCNIGRFEDQKDHVFLIDAFSSLLKEKKNFKLLLVGTGTLKKVIEKKVADYNIEDRVIFLENRSDVNNLLSASDLFVLPSKYEGLPVVLIEAQANGIPCLISDKVTSEVQLNNNIYSISKDSINKWVRAIKKHKDEGRITKLSKKLINEYDINKVAKFVQQKYVSK